MLVTFFFFKFFKYFTTVQKTKTIERMMTKFIIRRRWCSLGKLEYECDSEISLAWSWCLHFSLHQGWEQQQNWRPSSLSGFLRRDINEGFARGVKMQSSAQPSPSPQHPCNKNFRLYPLESWSPFLVDDVYLGHHLIVVEESVTEVASQVWLKLIRKLDNTPRIKLPSIYQKY